MIGFVTGFQPSPFLPKVVASPHVPRGITEGLPVYAAVVVEIERSDPF
jgi:hypothetical protein